MPLATGIWELARELANLRKLLISIINGTISIDPYYAGDGTLDVYGYTIQIIPEKNHDK